LEGGPQVNRALFAALVLLLLATLGCTRYVRIDDLAEEYYNLGNAFYDLEEYEEAERYYLRALELDPEFERAGFNLARALADQERYAESLELLQELLLLDPDNLQVPEAIAYVEYRRGNIDAAIGGYERVLDASPFRRDALYNLGVLLLEDGAELEARGYLAQAYDVSPEDPDVLYAYAEALFRTGRNEAGLSVLDDLREIGDLPEAYLRNTADRYAEAEFYADALVLYDRLLAASPEDPDAHFAKARILLTAAEEGDAGIVALKDALEAGFADTEAAGHLLAEPGLIRVDEVRELFTEYGVEPAADDPENEAAGPGGAEPGETPPAVTPPG
jgi:tetratricopeptide (TPR) repeat protein